MGLSIHAEDGDILIVIRGMGGLDLPVNGFAFDERKNRFVKKALVLIERLEFGFD